MITCHFLSFNAHHLRGVYMISTRSDLRRHHRINVFIRHWDLVRSRPHLYGIRHARWRESELVNAKQFLRFRSAHHTPGAVAARTERLFVTGPRTVNFSPPSNRGDTELTAPRRNRPFYASRRSLRQSAAFFLRIVMVAVDLVHIGGDRFSRRWAPPVHHRLAVQAGELLRQCTAFR